MKKFLLLLLLMFIVGCGASTQFVMPDRNIRLKQFNNVYVRLQSAGATSEESGGIGGGGLVVGEKIVGGAGSVVSGTHTMSGDKQAIMALDRFKFELAKVGFNIVSEPESADAYVDLSIGTIRYDSLAGWIADEGMAKFINKQNNRTIAYFAADTKFITPTVTSIIKNLVARIRKTY